MVFDHDVSGLAQLFDLQGRLVSSELINGSDRAQFDLGVEPTGTYLLRIVQGDEVLTERIVLQRP